MTQSGRSPTRSVTTRIFVFSRPQETPENPTSAFVKIAGNACATQIISIADIRELHKRQVTASLSKTEQTHATDSESGFLATK